MRKRPTSSHVFASISDHVLHCGLASRSVGHTYILNGVTISSISRFGKDVLVVRNMWIDGWFCRVLVGPDHLRLPWAEPWSSTLLNVNTIMAVLLNNENIYAES